MSDEDPRTETASNGEQVSEGSGQAHGKVILLGEHAVVYGYPAIGFPLLPVTVRVQIMPIEGEDMLDCSYYYGKLTDTPTALAGVKVLIEETRHALQSTLGALSITIASMIPSGYGMGSSAAVAVAIVRGLYDFYQHHLTHEQLLVLVHIAETYAHGTPSGVDAWTTSSDRPVWFMRGREPVRLSLCRPLYLVVACSRSPGNTREAVQQVRDNVARRAHAHPMARLGKLAEGARWALTRGDYENLGLLMTAAHEQLERFGITTDHMDALVSVALHEGAMGAKLTGSGGGGSIIALVADRSEQGRLAAALTLAGAVQVWTPVLKEDT